LTLQDQDKVADANQKNLDFHPPASYSHGLDVGFCSVERLKEAPSGEVDKIGKQDRKTKGNTT